MVCVDEGKTGSPWLPALRAQARVLATILGVTALGASAAGANAEERTLSLYHIHTKERITITYWKDGRFIPSALRKLNWFLRDWRKDRAVRMDPRTIDLIWKLHADLGSKKPVEIICGHRSAATNAMLRRIGRNVARRSRHITGQAIDFRFPDVPNWKVRNLALAYGIGGVGYYGRSGFIHVDTGSVRHWPRMPRTKVASIIRQYRKMIGRHGRTDRPVMVASARRTTNFGGKGVRATASAKSAARKAGTARRDTGPVTLVKKPVMLASANVPMPKPRPYQVLVQAAATMEVTPVSAPATVTNFAGRKGSVDHIGMMIANTALDDPTLLEAPAVKRDYPRVNRAGKGDLARDILQGRAKGVPLIRPLVTARAEAPSGKGDSWLGRVYATAESLIRRNGAPVPLSEPDMPADPRLKTTVASMVPLPSIGGRATARTQRVNRAGKGDLLTLRPLSDIRRQAVLDPTIEDGRPLRFR